MNLPRSTPAEQGVDVTGIDAFVAAVAELEQAELHSLMVLRHGHVVAEGWWSPYRPETPQLIYSLSKSFTSTALGLAVAECMIDLDATVLSYFPELDARVSDPRSRATLVRHVASMASGHAGDQVDPAAEAGSGDLLLGLLSIPPDQDPGTIFAYNQPCTYTLSAIIQRVSGQSLIEFLRPRLFEPLGISTYGWFTDRFGRQLGFSGLHVPTSAIAALGQLYLDGGWWQGAQLLPAGWAEEASRLHIPTPGEENPDWNQGYGFQFWRSRHGYRGDGAYGQYMVILPEADAVVAITSQSPDMQGVLDALWTHLLPALTATGELPAGRWEPGPLALTPPSGEGGPVSADRFGPSAANALPWLRSVEVRDGALLLTDDGPGLVVALGDPGTWTATGPVCTAHAGVDGVTRVELIFVETPHRLALRLDPARHEFTATWLAEPLHRVPLAEMRMPR